MTRAAAAPARGAGSVASLVGYAVLVTALVLAASMIGGDAGAMLQLAVSFVGTAALGYGVVRRRPAPPLAWWMVLLSVALLSGSAVAVAVLDDLSPNARLVSPVAPTMAILSQLCLVAGLSFLSRGISRRGTADILDAVMTALAVYLLLWALLIEPGLRTDLFPAQTAVALPILSLLVFTIAVRLMLGGGLRDPAVVLVLIGTMGGLLTVATMLILALHTGVLRLYWPLAILGSCYFAVMGTAGLHPALGQPRTRLTSVRRSIWQRMVLFGILALVPPVVWAVEIVKYRQVDGRPLPALAVPVVTSAVFLLLLVVRLGLITRVAQLRAGELSQRTAALARSVFEQQELQRQLTYRALHDQLTGLSNRVVLVEALERATVPPGALLMLDLDHFKDINDTLGHPVGDELLAQAARRLRALAPPDATIARLGGDEFAVFLPGADRATAVAVAQSVLTELRRVYHIGGRELFVTTSIGVLLGEHTRAAPTPSDRLRDADLALYAAKSAGKDRVTLFHPDLRTARLDHARISNGLRHALERDEMVVHYQPIVEVGTGVVVAVEALLRWRPNGGRLVPPADFIPVAEDTGLIEPIGDWALRQALHDDQRWYSRHGVAVCVNVSGRQLAKPEFASSTLDRLRESGLPGRALIIEITESSLVGTSRSAARAHLQQLRDERVRIAIDDFGTGYSSLSYVAQLPVDIVKIDKSFTQALGTPAPDRQDWAFTRAILQMVASLDKVAIAEGVETAAQAEALRSLRCPFVQGFHYSRPVPAEVIDRMLARPSSFAVPRPEPASPSA